MRVALAQVVTGRDISGNLELVENFARQAKKGGAEMVVFPEATMRAFGNSLLDIAEPLDGPWATRVRRIAGELGIVIVAGMFTPGDSGSAGSGQTGAGASDSDDVRKVRNTLLVTGPGVEASYDKIHLFDAFGFAESATVDAGTGPVTFELGGIRFGLATCYDVRFPALFTANADLGAEVNIVCASWGSGPGKVDQWRLLARARAVDTTTYVLACGQGDPATQGIETKGPAPTGVGHSAVVSPLGEVIEELDGGTGLLFADLNPAVVKEARAKLPVLANRHTFQ
ncbi:carbon-nitrogen hydrolase family protein [Arthrobacter sp. ISL-69]|uniref:carbon-nitrogen hydrolase family protein n=1 Tax=Arthrobacter sp. ISL-69 TaxID=2819113 RepID=UPI001BEB945B|nr:carbon-nitrogen hydrolase family protein [Arthrobacter sp. ISL-69]MBT2536306.1 carbon-nitrogen hydrolase family protein [Arthrobacter sp. ISL-69]